MCSNFIQPRSQGSLLRSFPHLKEIWNEVEFYYASTKVINIKSVFKHQTRTKKAILNVCFNPLFLNFNTLLVYVSATKMCSR